jgi:hypothetical protein
MTSKKIDVQRIVDQFERLPEEEREEFVQALTAEEIAAVEIEFARMKAMVVDFFSIVEEVANVLGRLVER